MGQNYLSSEEGTNMRVYQIIVFEKHKFPNEYFIVILKLQIHVYC